MGRREGEFWDYTARSLVDWCFRRRSFALWLFRGGLVVLTLSLAAGWTLDATVPFRDGALDLRIDSQGGTPTALVCASFILGTLMILAGAAWEFTRQAEERRRLARKRVIVVEQRGLRDTADAPLAEALPKSIEGHRDVVLIDLRERIRDGHITSPETALERVTPLPRELERLRGGRDRADLTTVYGGLAPVPFAFLAGVLMDDESPVLVFDWDRHAERWRPLGGTDDGNRFVVSGLDAVPPGAEEAVLAVSVSYRVDLDGIRRTLGTLPIVHCELPSGSPNCHWSEEKQRALARAFLDAAIPLGNAGVRRIHLIIAAQNSMAFRFGRFYDKRNLPPAIVYQYEQSCDPPYPWGVLMPTHGIDMPQIVRPPQPSTIAPAP